MPDLFGRISFPGVVDFIDANYTCSHGIRPGIISLTLGEEDLPGLVAGGGIGDFIFFDGINDPVVIPDCRVDSISYNFGRGALTYTVNLLDHRWRWAYGRVNGFYNKKDERGKVIHVWKRTLRDLVLDCLREMNEPQFDLSQLIEPNEEDLPPINWEYANPAQSLESLVSRFGYRVVWQPVQKQVALLLPGTGRGLVLNEQTIDGGASITVRVRAKNEFRSGPGILTAALKLKAVGREMNGEIREIDDLTYKPTSGWQYEDVPIFGNVRVPTNEPERNRPPGSAVIPSRKSEYQTLARNCIFRMYQISTEGVGENERINIPTFGDPGRIERVQLLNGIYTNQKNSDGLFITLKPRIHGVYYLGASNHNPGTNAYLNSSIAEYTEEGFSIDTERGIVLFDKPKYKNVLSGLWTVTRVPAELVLVCSVCIRATETNAYYRFAYPGQQYPVGESVRYTVNDSILYVRYFEFDPNTWQVTKFDENVDDCVRAAEQYLLGPENEDQSLAQGESRYEGLLPEDPDGSIQQISWRCGGGFACSTHASLHSEHAYWIPSYQQARRDNQLTEFVKFTNGRVQIEDAVEVLRRRVGVLRQTGS